MSKPTDQLIQMAVLESLKTNIDTASGIFGIDAGELDEYRQKYLLDQLEHYYPTSPATETVQLSWWERFEQGYAYEVIKKLLFTGGLVLLFWVLPYILRAFFDPLTNTVIWAGFTALYMLAFGSLGVELVFYAMHRVNFDFFNPFVNRGGQNDYETLIKSSDLTAYQKCVLNQQKYLAYLALFSLLVYSLLNQFQGQSG
ncbi:hypothetical protein [Fibrella forsythiae]|uniref:DUF2628 domain-containing protein n=1 Tax=Fibrella forsythiae TaxID=2817061 RepID=A0ABS3JMG9_9BACT|nr:hypothetical protein [Fibrella forsythiae]MBO0951206.1 hypothetical protein [Fibrella forsythiae]